MLATIRIASRGWLRPRGWPSGQEAACSGWPAGIGIAGYCHPPEAACWSVPRWPPCPGIARQGTPAAVPRPFRSVQQSRVVRKLHDGDGDPAPDLHAIVIADRRALVAADGAFLRAHDHEIPGVATALVLPYLRGKCKRQLTDERSALPSEGFSERETQHVGLENVPKSFEFAGFGPGLRRCASMVENIK
jgi:hypothetical protein